MSDSLNRNEASRYLGLSVGTLRNYHQDGKLVPVWNEERGRWDYPLAALAEFVAANVLLTSKGERPSATHGAAAQVAAEEATRSAEGV